jgi:hypothetical protein
MRCHQGDLWRAADDLLKAKAREWRNEKHQEQWRWSLTTGAAQLRLRPVDEIDTEAILAVLHPVRATTPETAQRLRARIEAVLDAAKAQGLRTGENPATWRGHLSHLLPKRQKLTRGHHAALPYVEMPGFMAIWRPGYLERCLREAPSPFVSPTNAVLKSLSASRRSCGSPWERRRYRNPRSTCASEFPVRRRI